MTGYRQLCCTPSSSTSTGDFHNNFVNISCTHLDVFFSEDLGVLKISHQMIHHCAGYLKRQSVLTVWLCLLSGTDWRASGRNGRQKYDGDVQGRGRAARKAGRRHGGFCIICSPHVRHFCAFLAVGYVDMFVRENVYRLLTIA